VPSAAVVERISRNTHVCGSPLSGVLSMAKIRKNAREDATLIKRAVASAVAEIERIERVFHKTLRSLQYPASSRATKRAAVRARAAALSSTVASPVRSSARRAAPVQSAITKVLKTRRRGLTMDGLREVLPQLDERSLLNATFAMRRKGLIRFEKSEKGRGIYRWHEQR
jgi:hypothetical protein